MPGLKKDDLDIVRDMRGFGLLGDMDPLRLMDIVDPTGMILCSDGHQKEDIDSHTDELWAQLKAKKFIHELKLAGLPLLATFSRLINVDHKENVLINDQIELGIKIGKINKRLINLGHWPCGLAEAHNLTIIDAFELMIGGRNCLAKKFPNLNVSAAIQIDYRTQDEERGRRTYHIETSIWEEYKTKAGYAFTDGLKERARVATAY